MAEAEIKIDPSRAARGPAAINFQEARAPRAQVRQNSSQAPHGAERAYASHTMSFPLSPPAGRELERGVLRRQLISDGNNFVSYAQPHPPKSFLALLVSLLLFTGCVSKQKAQMQARQAYMIGQQQAMAQQANQSQTPIPAVSVSGKVTNHIILWTDDLTLAKAIVEANYIGLFNPKLIRVTRPGESIEVDPNDLLKGKDIPLQVGDNIQIID